MNKIYKKPLIFILDSDMEELLYVTTIENGGDKKVTPDTKKINLINIVDYDSDADW